VFTTDLVLIGPSGSGKSTLANLLGEALKIPSLDLDDLRMTYYAEIGYDHEYAEKLQQEQGVEAMLAYWKPFEIHSVERMIEDCPSAHVLAFGAGQSVYDDPGFAERVRRALSPAVVVLLLPSPDVEESLSILAERVRQVVPDLPDEVFRSLDEMNRYFLEHPANAALADHTVYTKDRTAGETCQEILGLLDQ
jgi:adenylate kinase family enzyme